MEKEAHYYPEKQSIDLLKANKFGLKVLLITLLGSILLFYIIWHNSFLSKLKGLLETDGVLNFITGFLVLILVMGIGIVTHELIHGIFWAIFAKDGFRSIKFGILKQYLTPYCHCKEPLKVKHYITGAIMPAILLGFLPLILSLVYGSLGWLFFGIFFTAAAGGDFLMIKLLNKEPKNAWVQDHSSEPGYYIYRKKE
jgi:hypothetical protein